MPGNRSFGKAEQHEPYVSSGSDLVIAAVSSISSSVYLVFWVSRGELGGVWFL